MLPRLQFLTLDASPLTHRAQALAALEGGVRWIQLRAKHLPEDVWIAEAVAIAELCRDFGAFFVVNDSPQVALRAEADGVHLGGADASPAAARALLGESAIVGVTLNEPAHVARSAGVRIDYAGVGPVRHSASKQKLAAIHSAESLAALIAAAAPSPCFAIGGVTAADWPELRALGAHGIAVSGAIALAADPISAAKTLVEAVSA
ncbi:MAG: thiamine phosphate synthase [Opitutia bacterium]|nr:MAG: thiamine phosphate synthase [Opitutae bacterium]